MSNEITIRLFEPGDEKGIVDLLQLAFNGWPKIDLKCEPLDYWKWKYLDNPTKKMAVAVAEHNDQIVGCIHNVQQRVKIFEKTYLFPYGADSAVHPDYRKLGFHTKMSQLKNEQEKSFGGLEHYIVSSNPILIQKNIRHDRPRLPQDVNIYVKIRDVNKHIEKMPPKDPTLKKYGYLSLETWNKIQRRVTSRQTPDKDIEVRPLKRFNEKTDDLWGRVRDNYDFTVERTQDHCNWRYMDERAGAFAVLHAEKDGTTLGYIALRVNRHKEDYPIGFIVDLLTDPSERDAAHLLIRDAIEYFNQEEVNLVTGLSTKNDYHMKALTNNGFLDTREQINLFTWVKEVQSLTKESKIFFTLSDTDHV